jgi:probable F420-dependent oxidoreductase
MKVGILVTPQTTLGSREVLQAIGPAVEERDLASLWVAEHTVHFSEYTSTYPYSKDGKWPSGASWQFMEPFAMLTYLAATTERVRLGTGICVLPQRNPVHAAKAATTVDRLSHGRFDFGIGVGWLQEEFEALDAPFEKRGGRCDAYVDIMKKLWTQPFADHHSEFYDLENCGQDPRPIQTPHPPLHFGGESLAAARRVAELGNGWFGYLVRPEEVEGRVQRLVEQLEMRGRGRSDIEVSISPRGLGLTRATFEAYEAAGVDQLIVPIVSDEVSALKAELDGIAEAAAPLAVS